MTNNEVRRYEPFRCVLQGRGGWLPSGSKFCPLCGLKLRTIDHGSGFVGYACDIDEREARKKARKQHDEIMRAIEAENALRMDRWGVSEW